MKFLQLLSGVLVSAVPSASPWLILSIPQTHMVGMKGRIEGKKYGTNFILIPDKWGTNETIQISKLFTVKLSGRLTETDSSLSIL